MERANGASAVGDKKLTVDIRVYASEELKELAWDAAEKEGVPLSEYIVRVLASHLARPDLRIVPRKNIGRPRVKHPVNGNGHTTNGRGKKVGAK
jgi:hypothetical protein